MCFPLFPIVHMSTPSCRWKSPFTEGGFDFTPNARLQIQYPAPPKPHVPGGRGVRCTEYSHRTRLTTSKICRRVSKENPSQRAHRLDYLLIDRRPVRGKGGHQLGGPRYKMAGPSPRLHFSCPWETSIPQSPSKGRGGLQRKRGSSAGGQRMRRPSGTYTRGP